MQYGLNDDMKISVIIPTYNYARYLPCALTSIVKQMTTEIEVLVIDDGSTDETAAIVQDYQVRYPQIHYYYQANQGPAAARNQGVQWSQGEYILFLDADDELQPDAIARFVAMCQQAPTLAVLMAPHITIQENARKKKSRLPQISASHEENFIRFIRKKNSICHGAFLVKRFICEEMPYPAQFVGREDLVFFAHLMARYDIGVLSSPTVCIRQHAKSLRYVATRDATYLEAIAAAVFDPRYLTTRCMRYKKTYRASLYLSQFRLLYLAKQYREARAWYIRAIQIHPWSLLNWRYLRKFFRCFWRK